MTKGKIKREHPEKKKITCFVVKKFVNMYLVLENLDS